MKYSLILISIIVATFSSVFLFKKTNPDFVDLLIKDRLFSLEVAKTVSQKTKGLSGRNSLCSDCGMIFIYSRQAIYPFWMKNTLIPLDIVWIDKNGLIVDIVKGVPNDLSILKPKSSAQYIIELNSDTANKLNLKINDKIDIPKNI